jgi:hypothetical protein
LKENEKYLLTQVFSVVVVALLGLTFYMVAIGGMATSIKDSILPLTLIIIAITCLGIMSELTKISCMLSSKGRK